MAPLTLLPVAHVHARTFADQRLRSTSLFLLGYAATWLSTGLLLSLLGQLAGVAIRSDSTRLLVAAGVTALWQASPAKQWGLDRCHRRPALAAFGFEADRAALRYGTTYGITSRICR